MTSSPSLKVPALVVARHGSTRLEGKLLRTIGSCTVLEHLLARLRTSRSCEPVLCTTTESSDDPLVALAEAFGYRVFRGDANDVPARLLAAARECRAAFVVVVESDEVFTDAEIIDEIVERYRRAPADCVRVVGVPLGYWSMGLRTDAIERLCAGRPAGAVDGWGRFLEAPRFTVESFSPGLDTADPESIRLTLDYPEDLELIRAIHARLDRAGEPFTISAALRILAAEPELLDINRSCVERYGRNLAQAAGA